MKYIYLIICLLLPVLCYSQQVQTNVWSKEKSFTVGEGSFKSTHSTGTNSISISYDPINEFNVTVTILNSGFSGYSENSIILNGNEYEKFKKIITTYSEWRKAAIASDIALEKVMYRTDNNFEFISKPTHFSIEDRLNPKPKILSRSLEVVYKKGALSFVIYENNSYSNSIELSESEMIAIVGVFSNKTRISDVESKLKAKSKSWDSFETIN